MIKLQTREILRAAKRFGIDMQRGSVSKCALAPPARSVGFPRAPHMFDREYRAELAKALGVSLEDLNALEYGFEQSLFGEIADTENLKKNPKYKVGQRVAEKLGYKPSCTEAERYDRA